MPVIGEVSDELRNIIRLVGFDDREVPVRRQAERETIEAYVADSVRVVLVGFRVIAVVVVGVVGLDHLEGSGGLEVDVGHFGHAAMSLFIETVLARFENECMHSDEGFDELETCTLECCIHHARQEFMSFYTHHKEQISSGPLD